MIEAGIILSGAGLIGLVLLAWILVRRPAPELVTVRTINKSD
jgi:hypothetical protein